VSEATALARLIFGPGLLHEVQQGTPARLVIGDLPIPAGFFVRVKPSGKNYELRLWKRTDGIFNVNHGRHVYGSFKRVKDTA
jgi:hypothetical protein